MQWTGKSKWPSSCKNNVWCFSATFTWPKFHPKLLIWFLLPAKMMPNSSSTYSSHSAALGMNTSSPEKPKQRDVQIRQAELNKTSGILLYKERTLLVYEGACRYPPFAALGAINRLWNSGSTIRERGGRCLSEDGGVTLPNLWENGKYDSFLGSTEARPSLLNLCRNREALSKAEPFLLRQWPLQYVHATELILCTRRS